MPEWTLANVASRLDFVIRWIRRGPIMGRIKILEVRISKKNLIDPPEVLVQNGSGRTLMSPSFSQQSYES